MHGAVIALVLTSGCSAVFGLESPVREIGGVLVANGGGEGAGTADTGAAGQDGQRSTTRDRRHKRVAGRLDRWARRCGWHARRSTCTDGGGGGGGGSVGYIAIAGVVTTSFGALSSPGYMVWP